MKWIWVTLPVQRCAYVTTVSQATKHELMKYVPWCDPDKIVVIPAAISDRYQRKEKEFNKRRPRILQVGTAPNKNITRLAEALRGIECVLEVVGKLSDDQRAALHRNGIAYSNAWELSDEEMVNRYEESDIVALVSTYEGFGMPILEGQATGRPVITSRVLSMPEVAGSAACLVDPYDVAAIRRGFLRIIDDDEYRGALIRKGFDNVRRFDPHGIAMQYLDLYRRLAVQ
jgi:glycosyltransferase involved in cell wall biosynthesis